MLTIVVLALGVLGAAGACRSAARDPAPAHDGGSVRQDQTACQSDADCHVSCWHGAVNLGWWQKAYPGDEACESGCTRPGTEAPRCEGFCCVAYAFGQPDELCTETRRPPMSGFGPAHRCQLDRDCRLSCRLGAINAEWYGWTNPADCDGGCQRATMSVRCADGACLALRAERPDPSCSLRNVHLAK
jgi:hypothetical protein